MSALDSYKYLINSSEIINYSVFNLTHNFFTALNFILWYFLFWLIDCWMNTIMNVILLENDVHGFLVVRFFLLEHFLSFFLFFLSNFLSLLKKTLFSLLSWFPFSLLFRLLLNFDFLLRFFCRYNFFLLLQDDFRLFFPCF